MISELPETAAGTYLITTRSGSRHLVNYDQMTLARVTCLDSTSASSLRRDGEDIDVLSIGPCTVGKRLVLLLDLHAPGVAYTLRSTTDVVSIEPVDWDSLTGPGTG